MQQAEGYEQSIEGEAAAAPSEPVQAQDAGDGDSEEEDSYSTGDSSASGEYGNGFEDEHLADMYFEELDNMDELYWMQNHHTESDDSYAEDDWLEDMEGSEYDEYVASLPPESEYRAAGWQADGPFAADGWVESTRHWDNFQSEMHHRQAADALNLWKNPQGQWELTIINGHQMQLVRMEADGSCVEVSTFAFPVVSYGYSVARSQDGVTFAVGGDHGLLVVTTFAGEAWRLDAKLVLGLPLHFDLAMENIMVNGVRFARMGGKEYLMAAIQTGLKGQLYLLANPNTRESVLTEEAKPDVQYLVAEAQPLEVEAGSSSQPPAQLEPVTFLLEEVNGVPAAVVHETVVAGGSERAYNHVLQSPCGRYTVLATDARELWVADSAFHIRQHRRLEVPKRCGPAWAAPVTEECGAQYCAWSCDSRFLAATFDGLHWVGVWGTPDFQLLLTVEETRTPPLAIAFSPSRPGLLAFCERLYHVYLLDVDEEISRRPPQGAAMTLQCITNFWKPAWASRGVIDGLGLTDDHLVLATEDGLVTMKLRTAWTLENHKSYPEKFRQAARAFVQCACAKKALEHGERSVQDLPSIAVLKVVERLAASISSYFPPCAARPKLTVL